MKFDLSPKWFLSILDGTLVSIYFVLIGLLYIKFINTISPIKTNLKDRFVKENRPMIFLEVCYSLASIAVAYSVIHSIVKKIPFPFDGVAGYNHVDSEVKGAEIITTFILYLYHPDLDQKLRYLIQG